MILSPDYSELLSLYYGFMAYSTVKIQNKEIVQAGEHCMALL